MYYFCKKIKKYSYLLILIIGVGFMISGCDDNRKSEKTVSAAAIIGVHSNIPQLEFTGSIAEQFDSLLYDVSASYGNIFYIRCDGAPSIYFSSSITEPSTSNLSNSKLKSIAEKNASALSGYLFSEDALAVNEEVDTLGALIAASDCLNAIDETCDKRIFIADSGLSTCKYLDFTAHPILTIDKEELVEKLEEAKAIPDLNGYTLDWYFLGATAEPQKELSERQKAALQEIWEAILDAAGADYTIHSDVLTGDQYEGLPAVSSVEAEEKTLSITEYIEEMEKSDEIIAVLVDAEDGVKFNGNEATFVDEKAAREKIKEVAEILNQNKDIEILVVGTTANILSKDLDFFLDLSQRRAEAVLKVLQEYGIDANRMEAIGLGYKDQWYQDDINESTGLQIEEIAVLNRKCVIINKNSEEGEKSLNIYNSLH